MINLPKSFKISPKGRNFDTFGHTECDCLGTRQTMPMIQTTILIWTCLSAVLCGLPRYTKRSTVPFKTFSKPWAADQNFSALTATGGGRRSAAATKTARATTTSTAAWGTEQRIKYVYSFKECLQINEVVQTHRQLVCSIPRLSAPSRHLLGKMTAMHRDI